MDEITSEVSSSLGGFDMQEISTEVSSSIGGFNMQEISTEVTDCNAYILDSTTLLATPSSPHKFQAKNKGLYGKIPVTIAQPKVQIYVEAALRLPHSALAITSVSKNVILTRSQLMPTDDKKSAKLLINGFVRKTIQFAVPSNKSKQGISGDIRFSTFDIPFKCFAKVDYLIEPDFCFDESPRAINIADSCCFGADNSQYAFVNSQFLNEQISVELVADTIRDIGKKSDICDFRNGNTNRPVFRVIDESMVVELILRVTQNQLVEVPASGGSGGCSGSGGSGGSGGHGGSGGSGGHGGSGGSGGHGGSGGSGGHSKDSSRSNKGSRDESDDRSSREKKDDRNDSDDRNREEKKDDRNDSDDRNRGEKKDDREDRNSEDKRDDRDDRNDRGGRNKRDDKDDSEYVQGSKDEDYKEIGELKLSVPTRLMEQLKKYVSKS